jgi:hypothetical protein
MRKKGGRDEATVQKVYVMAGGFRKYSQWAKSAKYTEERVGLGMNEWARSLIMT